jgi:hypothetical protein
MVAVTTSLAERAEEIFTDLGYTVSGSGPEFRAERKWRVVQVLALEDAEDIPEQGDLRCFVAPEERASALKAALLDRTPEYDWALISVEDGGDGYEVLHPAADSMAGEGPVSNDGITTRP